MKRLSIWKAAALGTALVHAVPAFAQQALPRAALRPGDSHAERLAESLPLDPQTRELRDQVPSDPAGTEYRLGLRPPRGLATDLRGRLPSMGEMVDALGTR